MDDAKKAKLSDPSVPKIDLSTDLTVKLPNVKAAGKKTSVDTVKLPNVIPKVDCHYIYNQFTISARPGYIILGDLYTPDYEFIIPCFGNITSRITSHLKSILEKPEVPLPTLACNEHCTLNIRKEPDSNIVILSKNITASTEPCEYKFFESAHILKFIRHLPMQSIIANVSPDLISPVYYFCCTLYNVDEDWKDTLNKYSEYGCAAGSPLLNYVNPSDSVTTSTQVLAFVEVNPLFIEATISVKKVVRYFSKKGYIF